MENIELIRKSYWEIKNLMDKISKKEDAGWEGERRRTLLLMEMEKVINPNYDI